MIHRIKCWMEPFQAVLSGQKRFEFRLNDRDYNEGDILVLREWQEVRDYYTGREIEVQVTYILKKGFGLPDNYCIMSIERMP